MGLLLSTGLSTTTNDSNQLTVVFRLRRVYRSDDLVVDEQGLRRQVDVRLSGGVEAESHCRRRLDRTVVPARLDLSFGQQG